MGGANNQCSSSFQDALKNNMQVTWQKRRGQGSRREGQCACSHGNSMYLFGGVIHTASSVDEDPVESSELIRYHTGDDQWATCVVGGGGAPPSRAQASLVCVGDSLYLFGGVSHLTGWFNDFYVYDITSGKWAEIKNDEGSRPCPRDKLQAVVDGTDIYYFGGFGPLPDEEEGIDDDDDDESWEDMDEDEVHGQEPQQTPAKFGWFNDLYKFDTVTRTWSKPMQKNLGVPTPRAAHGMCLVGREIAIFGGRDAQGRTDDLHLFNVDTGKWRDDVQPTGRRPLPRSYHSVTGVSSTRLVVMGGLSQDDRHFADLHVYDTETNEWLQPSVGGDKPAARGQHSVTVIGDSLVLYGGTAECDPSVVGGNLCHDDTYTLNVGDLVTGGSIPSDGAGDASQ